MSVSQSVLWVGCQAGREGSDAPWLFEAEAGSVPNTTRGPAVCVSTPNDRLDPDFAPLELLGRFVRDLRRYQPGVVRVVGVSSDFLDLARVALALGFETQIRMPSDLVPDSCDQHALRWLSALLTEATSVICEAPSEPLLQWFAQHAISHEREWPGRGLVSERHSLLWGYQAYAFGRRDHRLLADMQRPLAAHFSDCGQVLDLGCGTGVFLDLLERAGIPAYGVERNPESVRYARALGLSVIEDDALRFLEAGPGSVDGVYCSHFVEHLPTEGVERLLSGVSRGLRAGGVAVFVFPDPESIRSQLLGFWRDPEHVRFYHPELVESMAEPHGLVLEYCNSNADGRSVVPFTMQPGPPPELIRPGPWARFLKSLGVAPQAELDAHRDRADWLERQMRSLWAVNQTWAWEDNAVMRFRKV